MGGQSRNNQDRCCRHISWLSEGSTLLGNGTIREPALGQQDSDLIVQRRERSHGRGIPDHPMRPTAGRRPLVDRDCPGRKKRSGENPRMRVCSPTSQATLLPLHDHGTTTSPAFVEEGGLVCARRLTMDIRGWATARFSVPPRGQNRTAPLPTLSGRATRFCPLPLLSKPCRLERRWPADADIGKAVLVDLLAGVEGRAS